jgi:hypothetical protein
MDSGIAILIALPLIIIGFRVGYKKGHKEADKFRLPKDISDMDTPIFNQMAEDFPMTHLLLKGKDLFNKNPELFDRLVKNAES